ncbi:MAG: M64 family metallopeptidase [Calditrichaceae bacterium]
MMIFMRIILMIIMAVTGLSAGSQVDFDEFFIDRTMRIDYYHMGNAGNDIITVDRVYREGVWAGNPDILIETVNTGRYAVKIYDKKSGTLIYTKGYDSYFGEYKTTTPALNGIQRVYHESALIPYPKNKILFTVEVRDNRNNMNVIFKDAIDPDSAGIIKEDADSRIEVYEIVKNGNPHKRVDLAIIAEGYTESEREKLQNDLRHFSEVFFSQEPYQSFKENFNVYGVFRPSAESGCDEPTHNTYRNTSLNTTFNSLGSPRYLLTEDNKSLHDIASAVPYDALLIMVNHERYGGGGIYNFFLTFTTGNEWSDYVFLHEFGHSFAGLADEYYSSSTAYNDFYPKGIEPVEPNITALLDPAKLKWGYMVEKNVPIPTPWDKEEYDQAEIEYQESRTEINKKIAEMNRSGAPAEEIKKMQEKAILLSKENSKKLDALLYHSKYSGKVGAFEGAGYSSEGLYRPALDCIMFSKGKKGFCPVCREAIIRTIKYYTE